MEVVPLPDPDAVARLAADVVEDLLRRRPDAVLGLATGSTPVPAYAELARRSVDGSRATVVLLDEYVGLPADHPQSYRATIRRECTDALGVDPARVHGPDPASAPADAGAAYERLLADLGGVDLQLLGIGTDGHLAFNEPGSSLGSRTRVKTLTAQTRRDNARFFGSADEVPRHALTQGLATILEARHLLLLATGAAKADAVAAALEGPLTTSCPASVLQLHPHATALVDRAAGARLARWDHDAEVYAAKPDWQGL